VAWLRGLLLEETAQLAASGLKGTLLLFRIAVIQQWSSLLQNIEEESFGRHLSQGRSFVQVANDFSSQHPEVVNVAADGLAGKVQPDEVFEEGAEARYHLLPGEKVFGKAHPAARPVLQVFAVRC
jgi:hypothetical protein